MNLRKPDRLAGAGLPASPPPAGACASAPEEEEPAAGAGNPPPAVAVTARDAVPASGPTVLDSSPI